MSRIDSEKPLREIEFIRGGMIMELGKSHWRTWEQGIGKEWLLTNGIGGYASSTVTGSNTRRYHGLLIASLRPPVDRHLILSQLDETVEIGDRRYDIHAFSAGGVVKKGYNHLQRFIYDGLPTYIYSIGDVTIKKTVCMVYGENTVIVQYHIISGRVGLKLKLTPLVNFRDHHGDSSRHHMRFEQEPCDSGTLIRPYGLDLLIELGCRDAHFTPLNKCWFENMEYAAEKERGLASSEDHYIPGYFELDVGERQERRITFHATVEKDRRNLDGLAVIRKEEERIRGLVEKAGYSDEFAASLVAAADKFIVYRKSTDAKTIIAGYPWFTDWGRDTMISLCGLTLSTKRFDDARSILYTFSRYVRHGLIPNMFPDEGQEPGYNSVDAALWYFEAVNKYISYTGDFGFVRENLYNSLQEIYQAFSRGTLFDIRMGSDFLISAGNPNTQLTWMDAKIGSWVVTPRQGKAVEINALWYNALRILEMLAAQFGENGLTYGETAQKAREAFRKTFWKEEGAYLYDVVDGERADDSIRPNQIIAASLSYPVIEGEMAKSVVDRVWDELYTSYGLRTLSQRSNQYRGVYLGDQYSRDSSYHQGTVWTWPLGHFITAFSRAYGKGVVSRDIMASFFKPFLDHLTDACLGNISEIFDGDEPLFPRGCFAQAWSVGEILRAYVEEYLE